MAANNNVVEAVIPSPEKSFFRLEYLLPPDQMQTQLTLVLTLHHRRERSYGNAWLLSLDKEAVRLIKEIVFQEQPKESHLFVILGELSASFESRGIQLGPVGKLYFPYFDWKIRELLEERATGILNSPLMDPLQKAKKIYCLIVREGMDAKHFWVEQIHELIFKGGSLSLYDAGLCEAALYHAQSKGSPGKRYL